MTWLEAPSSPRCRASASSAFGAAFSKISGLLRHAVSRSPPGSAALTYHIVRVVVRHSKIGLPMSALGQKRTCTAHKLMSALPPIATAKAKFRKRPCLLYPPKAGMCSALGHVCFGPIADTRGDLSDDLDTRSVIAPIARNPFLAVQARLVVGA